MSFEKVSGLFPQKTTYFSSNFPSAEENTSKDILFESRLVPENFADSKEFRRHDFHDSKKRIWATFSQPILLTNFRMVCLSTSLNSLANTVYFSHITKVVWE